jgi:hypothetical protein
MDLRARVAVLAGVVAFLAPAGASAALAPLRPATLTPSAPLDTPFSGSWLGGAVTASTGEVVHVYVYADYGEDAATAAFLQSFADFLAWLPHGPVELASVNAEAAPLAIVKGICGATALACYLRGTHELVVPANDSELPPTPGIREQLIAREFGYAIADFRNNTPWEASDTGPKFWATAEHVCERAAAGLVYPGADDDARLPLNPGAAWAESYRRSLEDVTARWGKLPWGVDESFLTSAGLAAVIRDVAEPWTKPRSLTVRASLTKKDHRRFVRVLETPLDGSFTATLLSGPRNATVRVSGLSDPVAFPTQFSGRVCGTRQVSIVVAGPRRGAFRLAISAP